MAWVTAVIKAILEWLTTEIKKDTKASDADAIPKDLKSRWKKRIQDQLNKQDAKKNNDS